jgi:hypothetical protein
MGKSSEDHTSVSEYYYREVKKLMKGFHTYFGATNEIRRMSVGCLFHSSDTPERQFITNTRKDFGKCSNYSYCVDFDKLPACKKFYKKSLSKLFLVIVVQNIANAINILVGLLIKMIDCKKGSQSQRSYIGECTLSEFIIMTDCKTNNEISPSLMPAYNHGENSDKQRRGQI